MGGREDGIQDMVTSQRPDGAASGMKYDVSAASVCLRSPDAS
jgi:hypothetical protein